MHFKSPLVILLWGLANQIVASPTALDGFALQRRDPSHPTARKLNLDTSRLLPEKAAQVKADEDAIRRATNKQNVAKSGAAVEPASVSAETVRLMRQRNGQGKSLSTSCAIHFS
jgi:hypothetical protein